MRYSSHWPTPNIGRLSLKYWAQHIAFIAKGDWLLTEVQPALLHSLLLSYFEQSSARHFLATNLFPNFLIACDTFSPQAKELLLIGLMRGIVCQNELVFAHLMNYIFGSNFELNVWTIHLVHALIWAIVIHVIRWVYRAVIGLQSQSICIISKSQDSRPSASSNDRSTRIWFIVLYRKLLTWDLSLLSVR